MATRSYWGGNPADKVKTYKPKNIRQAANNRLLAIEALKKGLCLEMVYDGLKRVVEVHTVGNTTTFRPAMSGWQIDGHSNTSPIPDWRLFCFDECFDLKVTDIASNAPREGYKRGAKQFGKIDVQL